MAREERIAAAVLALGMAVGGWSIGQGFAKGRAADRYVTVKGISERDVEANMALWPIRYVATDDSLARAQAVVRQSREKVLEFLKRHQIDPAAVTVHRLQVTDRMADAYRSGPAESRYIVAETLMVRTENTEVVTRASQAASELVDAGVVLQSEMGPSSGPTYLFTKLNDLKPAMIAEATASARQAAEQFAKDSGAELGGIRQANQGLFVIMARDRAQGINEEQERNKTVRVVSTVDFYLRD